MVIFSVLVSFFVTNMKERKKLHSICPSVTPNGTPNSRKHLPQPAYCFFDSYVALLTPLTKKAVVFPHSTHSLGHRGSMDVNASHKYIGTFTGCYYPTHTINK